MGFCVRRADQRIELFGLQGPGGKTRTLELQNVKNECDKSIITVLKKSHEKP